MTLDTPSASPAGERSEVPGRTIGRLWRDALAEPRDQPAYLVETDAGWRPVGSEEAGVAVDELANGLLALGVGKGDAFAILARTTLEWALFDFALGLVGAIAAPVYPTSSPGDTLYVVEHSEAVGVLAEDDEQLAKLTGASLDHRLTFADLDGLRARGRQHAQRHPRGLAGAEAAVHEDDLFTYIYTSGTTGPPKGCMIRHRNYYEMCAISGRIGSFQTGDTLLLYLPLAHNFGRLIHLLGPYLGYTIAFCPDPLRIADVLPDVRPTVLPSVPRVYEKVHAAVVAKFDEATGPRRRLIDWALGVGRRASRLRQEGRMLPRGLALQHRLADRLVYSKVKERLGGRLRVAISGGAPLAKEISEFFGMLDLPILEGYGLTECTTACTVNRPDRFRFGTVGTAMPGVELRIAPDGELEIMTPTIFAGYFKDEEATRGVLGPDGWLHTGDIAHIDDDGFVTITDRKKDIIVTAGGKNLAPQNLENELKTSKYVSQALVVGDRRPYVAALVTLDDTELRKWADARGFGGDMAALARREEVRKLVHETVDAVNEGRSRFEQIKRFAVLERDFSADHDEITPTLKLKRRVCEQHFADEIERLYAA
ncbi:MAG: long-chain fatty acid--CoA ligase [Gaiellaceae bacterium]